VTRPPTSLQAERLVRCELTDLFVADCAHCRGHRELPSEFVVDRWAVWPEVGGRRDLECGACYGGFSAGQRYAHTEGGLYLHAQCVP